MEIGKHFQEKIYGKTGEGEWRTPVECYLLPAVNSLAVTLAPLTVAPGNLSTT